MKILFMRHGKAVERGIVPEKDRYLTERGIEKLNDNLPHLAKRLRGRDIQIWTSDLKRSMQTGEILADCLRTDQIEQRELVKTGKFEILCEALSKFPKEKLLIIVGHEPHLSVWTYRLTGSDHFFKKGELLLMELKDDLSGGKILGTWKLKELKRISEASI